MHVLDLDLAVEWASRQRESPPFWFDFLHSVRLLSTVDEHMVLQNSISTNDLTYIFARVGLLPSVHN